MKRYFNAMTKLILNNHLTNLFLPGHDIHVEVTHLVLSSNAICHLFNESAPDNEYSRNVSFALT